MKRISDAKAAHSFVTRLIQNDNVPAGKRRLVDGMIDGNAPYNPTKLKKTGQAHRCNVNFREGEGVIGSRNTSFFQLFMDGRTIVECRLFNPHLYQGRARYWEAIVMEEMKLLFKKSFRAFNFEMMQLARSMNVHGVSFPMWETQVDWKWKAAMAGQILFPKNTKCDADYIEDCTIISEISIPELLSKMDDEKTAEVAQNQGWQIGACKKAIKDQLKGKPVGDQSWEQLQAAIAQDTLSYDEEMVGKIKIAHVLTREDDGKYSHYIIQRGKSDEGFLYKSESAYENIDEVFIPFICSVGNGYFSGLKGIGHRVFPSITVNNRLLCRVVDGAMDSQAMVLQFKDTTARRGKTMRLGNVIMLPAGADLAQHHLEKNLGAALSTYSTLTTVNQKSIGARRPGIAAINQNDKAEHTARADARNSIEEVELEATDIHLYQLQMDALYHQMCTRIWVSRDNDVKTFKEKCIERGVPEQLMSDVERWSFTAPRAIGSGSKVIRHMATQEVLSVAPYLPEAGKRNVIEDFIEARGGSSAVARYYPPFEDDSMPTHSHQMAQMENSLMSNNGSPMIVSMDDWHVTHLQGHFGFIEPFVENAMSDQSPEGITNAVKVVSVFLDHLGKHLAYLKSDDLHARQAGEFQQRLKALVQKVRKIEQAYGALVQQQKRAQEEQQRKYQELVEKGDQTELQKHLMDVQADVELRKHKENQNHQVRLTKMIHSMQLAEAETAALIEREGRKAAAAAGR